MSAKIKLIGYGSLINRNSLRKTIEGPFKLQEVWVRGYKRVFDLKAIKQFYEPWDTDVAVLNVEKCKGAKFNAIVYEVSLTQYHNLLKREKTYRLIKVKYSDYTTNKVVGEAVLFLGLEQFIHKNLNPRTHYFHICRKGAYAISHEYGRVWDKTTFLANGKRVSELGTHLIKLNKYHQIENPYPEKM
ncbi:MAG: gamma-glutamylcyclotransferase [Candidatus Aenigmarchaeota archaeon]|nr:gamma-glutamylcyclotransferase [Candidatus Aenigmarchaeota archaeon]